MEVNYLYKKILLSVIFVFILVFSISAIQAEDVNGTDSDSLSLNDENHIYNENQNLSEGIMSDYSYSSSVGESDSSFNETIKNKTLFTSPTNSIYYKGDYSVTLKDSNSRTALVNKTVNLVINNDKFNVTTNSKGIVSVNLNFNPGKYYVFASFSGDDSYESCNFTSNVEILPPIKAIDLTKYYKGSTKYTAIFYTSQGNFLVNKMVTITVNGKSYKKQTNNKGYVSFDINLNPGNYKIVATDPNTGYEKTTNFKILPTISSHNLNKVKGDSRKFTAKFLKNNGKSLSKTYIKFKLKGKTYKVKTSKYGFASLSLKKLKKGTYKITCYNKDGFSKTFTIKVFKRKASTKLATSSYKFFVKESKQLKVKLSTALADSSCSGKVIKIKINGKTYSKKTNSKGEAYLKLPSLKKGLYNVEYKYNGNKFFKASKSKKLVTIIDTSNTKISVKGTSSFGYGAGTQLKVAYTAGGVPLAKKSVTLKLAGKTYKKTTDLKGMVYIPINLNIGDYVVEYKTNDEWKLKGTSGTFDINVFKRSPSKIIWKSGKSFKDNSQTFKVLVSDSKGKHVSGGRIVLTIDSQSYSAKVSSSGYAKVKTSVDIGKYKVSVKFKGNNNFLPSSGHKKVNVKLSKFGKGINEKHAVALKAYLKSSSHCKVGSKKIKSLVKSLTKGLKNKVDKAKAIFNYVRDTLDYSYYYNSKYGASGTLKVKKGNCVDHSHLLVAMFRTAGLHARYVHGKCHFKSGETCGHVWTQVKLGKNWVCADAVSYRNSLGKINNWYTKSYSVHNKYASLPF